MNFDRHDTYETLSTGEKDGVSVCKGPGGAGEVRFVSTLRAPHTATDDLGFYNGGRYHWGSLISPVYEISTRFDTLVPSWNAKTPAGTWLELEMRVRSGNAWINWFGMGVWASGTESVQRHSVNDQKSGDWRVSTDTIENSGLVCADAYRYRLTLFTEEWEISPTVQGIFVATSGPDPHGENPGAAPDCGLWGRELRVPARSQMVYPEGGEAWCSPTSLSMVMAYWAEKTGKKELDQSVPSVALGTYDSFYGGTGNWPFNTAYASSLGLRASVNRFRFLGQVERWVDCGVPIVASIRWDNGEKEQRLSGAPLPSSDGHLLVIRGFDSLGNVVVNDPAGSDDSLVRLVYRRDEFARAWAGSGGIVYLLYPNGWSTPDSAYARGSW